MLNPIDIAMRLLKEFYMDDRPEAAGFYTPPNEASMALASLPRTRHMDSLYGMHGIKTYDDMKQHLKNEFIRSKY